MSDPFNIIGSDPDAPVSFDEAFREAVGELNASLERFEELGALVPLESYTEEEWRVVESADADVSELVERAEEAFIAVQYDSHAWYRVMENLQKVTLRLQGAVGVMERARNREQSAEGAS
jgi:hypothetical protein